MKDPVRIVRTKNGPAVIIEDLVAELKTLQPASADHAGMVYDNGQRSALAKIEQRLLYIKEQADKHQQRASN